jgi:voltage-gated potassium channel
MKTHRANSAQEVSGAEEPARSAALDELEDWLEEPVAWLGLVWLGLLVVETVWGSHPLLDFLVYAIWAIFIVEFGLRFVLAPAKREFLRRNWLTVISLPFSQPGQLLCRARGCQP